MEPPKRRTVLLKRERLCTLSIYLFIYCVIFLAVSLLVMPFILKVFLHQTWGSAASELMLKFYFKKMPNRRSDKWIARQKHQLIQREILAKRHTHTETSHQQKLQTDKCKIDSFVYTFYQFRYVQVCMCVCVCFRESVGAFQIQYLYLISGIKWFKRLEPALWWLDYGISVFFCDNRII